MSLIVFFPGASGRGAFWRPVAERLADVAPPVLFGWPGFGELPAVPSIRSLDDLYAWVVARLPTGRFHLVAQSMGGVLAARLAIDHPERIISLVLCATSAGVDVTMLGCEDWRPRYRAELPDVPDWFEADRTDLTESLGAIEAPTLVLHGAADPICPPAAAELLSRHIPFATVQALPGEHDFANRYPDETAERIGLHIAMTGNGFAGRRRRTTGFY